MTQYLTDDELLDVPLGNLTPGELARSFRVHATHEQKAEEQDAVRIVQRSEQALAEDRQREEEQTVQLREAAVLAQIRVREEALLVEEQQQDARAIRLSDGRRAYVDGDKYRGEDGRELKGADRAQAELAHLDHPDATTWQEHERLQTEKADIEMMRRDVEAMEQDDAAPNAEARLTTYEKELQAKCAAEVAKHPAGVDYGSGDYASELSGLVSTFRAANKAGGALAPPAPVQARSSPQPTVATPRF